MNRMIVVYVVLGFVVIGIILSLFNYMYNISNKSFKWTNTLNIYLNGISPDNKYILVTKESILKLVSGVLYNNQNPPDLKIGMSNTITKSYLNFDESHFFLNLYSSSSKYYFDRAIYRKYNKNIFPNQGILEKNSLLFSTPLQSNLNISEKLQNDHYAITHSNLIDDNTLPFKVDEKLVQIKDYLPYGWDLYMNGNELLFIIKHSFIKNGPLYNGNENDYKNYKKVLELLDEIYKIYDMK